MALNFPNSPTNGQIYTDTSSGNRWSWDSANTCWISTSTFTQTITVASSAPGSPVVGQLWWNQDYGRLLVYYNDGTSSQWVDASPSDATNIVAFNTANAAFSLANVVAPQTVTSNNAYLTANAAYGKANTAFQNTSGTFAGNLNVSASSLPLTVNSTNSNHYKVILQDNGTTIGYFGGTSSYPFSVANTSVTTLFSVDSVGRVTKPYQPFFMGQPTTDYSGGSMPTQVMAITSLYNNGNHFNASNNRFTCPITGWYRVTWGGLQLAAAVTSLMINGSRTYNGNHYNGSGISYITMTQTVLRQFSLGDYLEIEQWNGGGYHSAWWLWTVELVG